MLLAQFFYGLYLRLLAIPLILSLILLQWKKEQIHTNLHLLQLPVSFGFRVRFYTHAALDALRVVHGYYGLLIRSRARDRIKLNCLRAGSALFLSAHFHNWEMMGSWLCRAQAIPLHSLALPFKNTLSNQLLKLIRQRLRIPIIERDIVRTALGHLRAGRCIGMLWDQYPLHRGPEARFFALKIKVDPLPGFLALKGGSPAFFGTLIPGGVFRIVQLTHSPASPVPPEKLARRYHRVLEILIRSYPSYWYGLAHRRFKDQILYGVTENVSRETAATLPLLVSRETKRAENHKP